MVLLFVVLRKVTERPRAFAFILEGMNPLHGWKPTATPKTPPIPDIPARNDAPNGVPAWKTVANQSVPLKQIESLQELNNAGFCEINIPVDIERHVKLRRKMIAEGHELSTIPDSARLSAEDLLERESDEYRVLYCTFVDQYMIDFDPVLSAMRCGFNGYGKPSEAAIVAENLMGLPVVQRLIAEYSTGRRTGNATSLELVFAMLHRETMVNVPGSTQKGRLDAIRMVGELSGHVSKTPANDQQQLGVIEVPQMFKQIGDERAVEAQWEAVAMASQKALKDSVRD
jgi:hypothetical protein